MGLWLHAMILATSFAATVAVGLAGAAIYDGVSEPVSAKGDRLPITVSPTGASAEAFVTIETKEDGSLVLRRVPLPLGSGNRDD